MSRLDGFIRRMSAQRDILNDIRDEVGKLEGDILELGLGNGRTFDHLRELFPNRRIIVFDRDVRSHLSSTPEPANTVLGEIRENMQRFAGSNAALVHADIGSGYDDRDAITLTWLPQAVAGALAPGGFAVSGLPLAHPELVEQPQLPSVPAGSYFCYRRAVPAKL